MMLPIPTYDSDQFSWHRGKTGTAFLTDLCGRGKLFSQVFDDACDEGFNVRSSKTGRVVLFTFVERTETDPFEYVFHSIDGNAQYGKFQIRVLNT